jgi:hypothetical protein
VNKCAAIKADGTRCGSGAVGGSQYCYMHNPANAEAIKRATSKAGRTGGGGRAKPTNDLKRLQKRFEELAQKVLDGEIERSDGAVASQLLNGARACARDLRAREHEELLARLEKIEEHLEDQRKARQGARYGT